MTESTQKNKVSFENETKCRFKGIIDETIRRTESVQLLDEELWKRFVQQFRSRSDSADARWRGEYWGKMMRGACLTYSYTQNEELYGALTETVRDMLSVQEENGRISSFNIECEFDGWDIWNRKYVLLGMQYYYEICRDSGFKDKLILSMRRQLDYIMSKIGRAEQGKLLITMATRHWRGLNSSSLLEPVMKLYSMTDDKRYLEFADYIVECGGTSVVDIFRLAYENKLHPYQYPITKAYEMISCFEGLLQYWRVTGNEKHKQAIINFADRILEDEFTVIGCCGTNHEFFDNAALRQANTTNGTKMQETCVTVTVMLFFRQMFLLCGDSKYMDAFETSMYNAFLGAVNTENANDREPKSENVRRMALPFDSYSPLTAGTRGSAVGGYLELEDGYYYGCCACIGAAGSGIIPKTAVMKSGDGILINLFISGEVSCKTPCGKPLNIKTETEYPKYGEVNMELRLCETEEFEIAVRNPHWSRKTRIYAGDVIIDANPREYIRIRKAWSGGDKIRIIFDFRTEAIYPQPYGNRIIMQPVWGQNYMIPQYDEEDVNAKKHIALRRGPIMLALDSRMGTDPSAPHDIDVNKDGFVDVMVKENNGVPKNCILQAEIPLRGGKSVSAVDYASAGKLWNDSSVLAVWLPTADTENESGELR